MIDLPSFSRSGRPAGVRFFFDERKTCPFGATATRRRQIVLIVPQNRQSSTHSVNNWLKTRITFDFIPEFVTFESVGHGNGQIAFDQ